MLGFDSVIWSHDKLLPVAIQFGELDLDALEQFGQRFCLDIDDEVGLALLIYCERLAACGSAGSTSLVVQLPTIGDCPFFEHGRGLVHDLDRGRIRVVPYLGSERLRVWIVWIPFEVSLI